MERINLKELKRILNNTPDEELENSYITHRILLKLLKRTNWKKNKINMKQ